MQTETTWCSHPYMVFLLDAEEARQLFNNTDCRLIKAFCFDEGRMAVGRVRSHAEAVEFYR